MDTRRGEYEFGIGTGDEEVVQVGWWVGECVSGALWRARSGLDGFFERVTDEVPVDFGSFGYEVGRDPGAESFEEVSGVVVEVVHGADSIEELVQRE